MAFVQPSADEAVTVRMMRFEHRARVLWIDAVCMIQNSTEDKNQQVAFIGSVYKYGTCNLIYLGEIDWNSPYVQCTWSCDSIMLCDSKQPTSASIFHARISGTDLGASWFQL